MGFQDRQDSLEVKNVLAYLRLINDKTDNHSFERIINFPPRGIGNKTLLKIKQYSSEIGLNYFDSLQKIPSSGKLKNYIMDVQETVWDYFDDNGKFVADETVTDKQDLINLIANKFGLGIAVDVAKKEIFDIETNDYFS